MNSFQIDDLIYLEPPQNPRTIIFCDFDETYYPHSPGEQELQEFRDLEDLIAIEAASGGFLFGWVTGSSLESIEKKLSTIGAKLVPHFIASSMGSLVTYHDSENNFVIDKQWIREMEKSGYSKLKISALIEVENDEHEKMSRQPSNNEWIYKQSYYLKSRSPSQDEQRIQRIRHMAKRENLSVNISRCNPMTNDPADCYDVDFTPIKTGKVDFVNYMCRKYDIATQASYAFGDSGNDIEMLKAVGHGYLVANATDEAKALYAQVSPFSYSRALFNVIKAITRTGSGVQP